MTGPARQNSDIGAVLPGGHVLSAQVLEAMSERYALYFAPDTASPLWHRACAWLGRDPASNELMPQPVPDGFAASEFADLTEDARRYGFHATLRSPFRLADGYDRERLEAMLAGFAARTAPASLGPVEIRDLMGFLAVMPVGPASAVTELAANCVARFEICRSPLGEAERQRRLAAGLSARQAELLDQYGYPYVMDEFRFHMTVSDRLDRRQHGLVAPAARAHFATALAAPLVIDRVVLFHEPEPGAPFLRLADFPLAGAA